MHPVVLVEFKAGLANSKPSSRSMNLKVKSELQYKWFKIKWIVVLELPSRDADLNLIEKL